MDISLLLSTASATACEHSFQSVASTCVTQGTNPNQSANTDLPYEQPSHRKFSSPLPIHPHSLPPFSRLTSPLLPPPAHPASASSPPAITTATSAYRLQVHLGRVDKRIDKPFQCAYQGCAASFGQKGSLTRHIRSRHEKLRPHCCDLCQKSFSALWTLRVHQRNVHLKSKPHKCHLCDKSFGELFNKSKHIAIVHEGKRPFACPICSRAFGYKGDMRKHVLELHEQSGRPFQCVIPSCGVKFARKRYLRRHENLSHKGHPLLINRECSPPTIQSQPQPQPETHSNQMCPQYLQDCSRSVEPRTGGVSLTGQAPGRLFYGNDKPVGIRPSDAPQLMASPVTSLQSIINVLPHSY